MPMNRRFEKVRFLNRVNRVVQVSLAVLLGILLNLIGARDYVRRDLTFGSKYALSPESRAYIRQLDQEVQIILSSPGEANNEAEELIASDLSKLLREYSYAGRREGRNLIRVEHVDVFRQRRRAAELAEQYGLSPDQRSAMIVASGPKSKEVNLERLYDADDEGNNLFVGERVLTAAILEVSSSTQTTVWFLKGHGEMQPGSTDPFRGMSRAVSYLRNRNWHVEELDLTEVEAVPDVEGIVIIAAPQSSFLPFEQEILRNYLGQRKGRVLILLEPGRKHGLDDLFFEWGLLVDDRLVIENAPASIIPGGDMLISRVGKHPITEFLFDRGMKVLTGIVRPVREDLGAPADPRLSVTPLLESSDQSWAEQAYRSENPPRFTRSIDIPGPVPIAMVADRTGVSDVGIQVDGGRLIVFGSADVFANLRFDQQGNLPLFHSTVNWLADRDDALLNIPPRRWRNLDVTISKEQYRTIGRSFLYLPAGIAILGILVHWLRRS